jgi:hypothetical protein
MKLAKKLMQDFQRTKEPRTYSTRIFKSKSNPSVDYLVRIFYGGTFEKPNLECNCPKFTMSNPHWCRHCDEAWNSLDGFGRALIVHHDEIRGKEWWHSKNK